MCKIFEDMQKEAMIKVAKRMIADGVVSLETAVEYFGLSLEEVESLQKE